MARGLARRALAPVERFLAVEAASGIVLLVTSLAALLWANSPYGESYQALWHFPIGLRLGSWSLERDLHFWINDGLMTIFFFVVGLEIRREMHHGELSEIRRATLPLAAALGGMLVPAALYFSLNQGRPSQAGWGVPMATDIAFAVGVLALLGKRVPPALRILLLTLAVIDDVGAIVVIALFYSSGIVWSGFVLTGIGIVLVALLQAFGVRSPWLYVPSGAIIWAGAYSAGIHPTLAGVVVGMMTPVTSWYGAEGFLEQAETSVEAVRAKAQNDEHAILPHLDALDTARREAVSPVERLQHSLHGWVAFGIMPLFALANAGVPFGSATLAGNGLTVFLGVFAGLLLGKPAGILLFSWLAAKLGLAALPSGIRFVHVGIVGAVAGIGFTMAIFIAQLAFPPGPLLETAKLAILVSSATAAVGALAFGRLVLTERIDPSCAPTEREAEASTTG